MFDDRDKHHGLGLPQASRPISFLAAPGWSIGAMLVLWFTIRLTDGARPGAATDLVNLTACEVLSYSILILVMLRIYAPEASVREVLGVRASSPWATLLSLAAGVTLIPALSVVDDYMAKRFPSSAEDKEFLEKLVHADTLSQRIVLVAALGVVIPLSQELFFRGALFSGLRRGRPEGLAVLASAALFALSLDPRGLLTSFVLGLFASWLRGRSGSIVPSTLALVAYYSAQIVAEAMGKGDITFGPRIAVGGAVVTAILAWGAGLIFARDPRAERGRLLDA